MGSIYCGNCLDPCNCLLTEDGFFANRPQDGRQNTLVTGRGTLEDPYILSFQQSEFYRPETGELRSTTTRNIANNTSIAINESSGDILVPIYQTPNSFFVEFPPSIALGGGLIGAFGNFKIVGTSVTFDTHITGVRYLSLIGLSPSDASFNYVLAGATSLGHAGGVAKLSCSAFSTGVFDSSALPPIYANNRIDGWGVGVWQTSGVSLAINNIKFWVAAL